MPPKRRTRTNQLRLDNEGRRTGARPSEKRDGWHDMEMILLHVPGAWRVTIDPPQMKQGKRMTGSRRSTMRDLKFIPQSVRTNPGPGDSI